jgi:hypothetical protein
MSRVSRYVLLTALVPLLVAGCASDKKAATSRCDEASTALLAAIAAGLSVDGEGALPRGSVVRSSDYKKLYFAAAEIDGPGLEGKGDVGVWVTNSLSGEGLIMSVNSMAEEFSDWALGEASDANTTMSDDGAAEAEECAGS